MNLRYGRATPRLGNMPMTMGGMRPGGLGGMMPQQAPQPAMQPPLGQGVVYDPNVATGHMDAPPPMMEQLQRLLMNPQWRSALQQNPNALAVPDGTPMSLEQIAGMR